MKKKSIIALLAAATALCCALGLTACGGGSASGGGHKHNYRWVDNGDGTHRQHCSADGCEEPDVNNESHVWSANGKCGKCDAAHIHDYKWVDNGDGTHKKHCSVVGCDKPDKDSGSHVWGTDGKCGCGAEMPDQHLTFALNEGGDGYTVTGKEAGSPTDIIIPYTYEGLPVTAIAAYAFSPYWQDPEAVALTSVTLPESVTEIGNYAFYQSTIKTINLSRVKTIGECAFRDSHLGGDLDLTEIETLG
ncbi:MAG: leucine-rich repeat domain-containing protein, partial [Clostridia bacterium]|nr:leucine-rich repeat domain-containing protein [Clostridia bacterium]